MATLTERKNVTIFISILSSFIAAFLAHHLATSRMRLSELSKFQSSAYSDFLGASARLAVARRLSDTSNENIDLAALNDAKARIIICGDREIVEALAKFWELGGTLESESEILAFNNLIKIIRNRFGHNAHDIQDLNISNSLFKLEPRSFSFKAAQSATKSNHLDAKKSRTSV